ncbi:hypothetical protein [Devosia salina]|uniref:Uncharacterized protein n=1 Tax=Devosia salina TaxID=2860336 RepID=A0ABX8WHN8_9HYPH|nr:hypothetical protein [Devosia salina]QYO78400.1 hypothetical protein K1X15_07595 [Devosia salina]
MTRPNIIITAAYIAVAGMLIASAFCFGIGNTAIGVLVASAIVAWSRST